MPVVFRHNGFRFFFYSNEGSPRERLHIYTVGSGGEAKFWLKPEIALDSSFGLDAKALRELQRVVSANAVLIEEKWNDYFGA